jgi:hypothetical protein
MTTVNLPTVSVTTQIGTMAIASNVVNIHFTHGPPGIANAFAGRITPSIIKVPFIDRTIYALSGFFATNYALIPSVFVTAKIDRFSKTLSGVHATAQVGQFHILGIPVSYNLVGNYVTALVKPLLINPIKSGLSVISAVGHPHFFRFAGVSVFAQQGGIVEPIITTGLVATAEFNNLIANNRVVNIGQSVNTFAGHPISARNIGLKVTSSINKFLPFISTPITGLHGTAHTGAISIGRGVQLTGLHATTTIGSPTKQISISSSFYTTVHIGTFNLSAPIFLSSAEAITHFGILQSDNIRNIIGNLITTHAGYFSNRISITPLSLYTNAIQGILAVPITIFMKTQHVNTAIGQMVFDNVRTIVGRSAVAQEGSFTETYHNSFIGIGVNTHLGTENTSLTKSLVGQGVSSHSNNLVFYIGHISGISVISHLSSISTSIQKSIIGLSVRANRGFLYSAKTLSGLYVTSSVGHSAYRVSKNMIGQIVYTSTARLMRQNTLIGKQVTATVGYFRSKGVPVTGLLVTSGVSDNAFLAIISLYIDPKVTALTGNFIPNYSVANIIGQSAYSYISPFRSIFTGVSAIAYGGSIMVSTTYPQFLPHPSRKPPPYRLVSIHDLFTNRDDGSDPTDSYIDRRRDVGKYTTTIS